MRSLKFSKRDSEGTGKPLRRERRSGRDRRSGVDRRASLAPERRRRGRRTRDLYKNDLDRHLWSWPSPAAKPRRKPSRRRARRRTIAGILASAAGAVGAAGLSLFLLRQLREEESPHDPEYAEADLNEADFED